ESAQGPWKVDHTFDERLVDGVFKYPRISALRVIEFKTDYQGKLLSSPVSVLFAALDGIFHQNGSKHGAIYMKDPYTRAWVDISPSQNTYRAIGSFRDPITGVDLMFVGGAPQPGNFKLFRGALDVAPSHNNRIMWSPLPEFTGFQHRIMSFAVANNQ